MLLLIWQKDILSGYFEVLHANTASCHAVGKTMVLTLQFSLVSPRTVSSRADKAVARALAPRYRFVFGLVACPHPQKLNLPNSTSLEAEKASLGIHPKQHELKCKRATPAPFRTGASSAHCRSVQAESC